VISTLVETAQAILFKHLRAHGCFQPYAF